MCSVSFWSASDASYIYIYQMSSTDTVNKILKNIEWIKDPIMSILWSPNIDMPMNTFVKCSHSSSVITHLYTRRRCVRSTLALWE